MTPAEVRTVRRRLEGYLDLLKMAEEQEQEIERLHQEYVDLATPSAIPITPKEGTSGSRKEASTIYHEIFSDQLEAERKAKKYREEAENILLFIQSVESGQICFLEQAYIQGKRFWEIGEEEGYSKEAVYQRIMRSLEKVDAALAIDAGLL